MERPVPFVPVRAVEAVETHGGDDTQGGQETHANEESERDQS